MSNVVFLIRPKPLKKESLTGYIQRVAKANCLNPNDIWRFLKLGETHYPQQPLSYLLDIYPETIFNIREFEKMLMLEAFTLDQLTFKNIIKMLLSIDNFNIQQKTLSRIIDKHRKFCPICLKEIGMYKLLWQIDEVKCCEIHKIPLLGECLSCGRKMPLLPARGNVGVCPFCNSSISKEYDNKFYNDPYERILNDWVYLADGSADSWSIPHSLSVQQILAMKLLYIMDKLADHPSKELILKIAKRERYISINQSIKLTFRILRELCIPIEKFTSILSGKEFDEYVNNLNDSFIEVN